MTPHQQLAGIRRFFLQPQETYSLGELAALWRISVECVREICCDKAPDALRIAWADALEAAITFTLFRPVDVERALGSQFGRVRSELWRTVPLHIYVPRFIVQAIEFDGVRTQSARIEKFLFDLFPQEYPSAFAAALRI